MPNYQNLNILIKIFSKFNFVYINNFVKFGLIIAHNINK